ncbi:MAG: hypothetical protein AAGA47_07080 [Pseudomonadota bacterium]
MRDLLLAVILSVSPMGAATLSPTHTCQLATPGTQCCLLSNGSQCCGFATRPGGLISGCPCGGVSTG